MCGIAGVMMRSGASPDQAALAALTKALAHRGPDGEGQYIDGAVGLVHTRLAIIDLETGDQPLFEKPDAQTSGATVITNGEIYNYRELQKEFPAETFHTASDCEQSLHLYRRDGTTFARNLRGMYAIALYDADIKQLLLCRDPFGIKPLYYCELPDGLAFSFIVFAIIAFGFPVLCSFRAIKIEGMSWPSISIAYHPKLLNFLRKSPRFIMSEFSPPS